MLQKTVFISGGAVGIGRATARVFNEDGYNVAFGFCSHETEARRLVEELNECGGNASCYRCDVSDVSSVDLTAATVLKKYRKVDVLVCNSGVDLFELSTDATKDSFNRVMDVNAWGTVNTCRAFVPNMISRQKGAIVTVGSVLGSDGGSMESLYAMSKGGILAYSLSLAKELGASGITVNCVLPGLINTAMNQRLTKEEVDELLNRALVKRMGNPEDVAKAILFLATNDYITATALKVDGGIII